MELYTIQGQNNFNRVFQVCPSLNSGFKSKFYCNQGLLKTSYHLYIHVFKNKQTKI